MPAAVAAAGSIPAVRSVARGLGERAAPVSQQVAPCPDRGRDAECEAAVGLAQTIGPVLAVPLLELAAKKLPRVRIRIRELMSSDIPELLRSESIDFALSYAIPSGRGVQSVNVFSEDLFLVGNAKSASHYFASATMREVQFADLQGVPLYLSSRSNGFREELERIARRTGC